MKKLGSGDWSIQKCFAFVCKLKFFIAKKLVQNKLFYWKIPFFLYRSTKEKHSLSAAKVGDIVSFLKQFWAQLKLESADTCHLLTKIIQVRLVPSKRETREKDRSKWTSIIGAFKKVLICLSKPSAHICLLANCLAVFYVRVCDQPKMVTILGREQNIKTVAIKNIFIKKFVHFLPLSNVKHINCPCVCSCLNWCFSVCFVICSTVPQIHSLVEQTNWQFWFAWFTHSLFIVFFRIGCCCCCCCCSCSRPHFQRNASGMHSSKCTFLFLVWQD